MRRKQNSKRRKNQAKKSLVPKLPTPSAQIPLDKLGPSGTKGELTVLAKFQDDQRSDSARLRDEEPRQFKLAARLARSFSLTDEIRGEFSKDDGGSYLIGLPGAEFYRVVTGDCAFEFKMNKQGEHSLIEFECTATNRAEARRAFYSSVLPFLDHLAYLANSPVVIATLKIEDVKNSCFTIDYVSPYRKATVNTHEALIYEDLLPVFAMYREAINSHSNFYRFLCYYKILEGLLGSIRAKVYSAAKANSIKVTLPNERVPDGPHISAENREHVGKPIKQFFDNTLTPLFRNAVAHFITDDGSILNMSSSEHIEKFESIIFISELCVRSVIENHKILLSQLNGTPQT
jgi:hypothetical protein